MLIDYQHRSLGAPPQVSLHPKAVLPSGCRGPLALRDPSQRDSCPPTQRQGRVAAPSAPFNSPLNCHKAFQLIFHGNRLQINLQKRFRGGSGRIRLLSVHLISTSLQCSVQGALQVNRDTNLQSIQDIRNWLSLCFGTLGQQAFQYTFRFAFQATCCLEHNGLEAKPSQFTRMLRAIMGALPLRIRSCCRQLNRRRGTKNTWRKR